MLTIDTIATPLLVILTLIELSITFFEKEEKRLKDMLANICLGLFVILTGFVMKVLALVVYTMIYSVAFIKPTSSFLLWVIAFLLCDLVLYIYHLLGHKTRLLWAAHVAHHSSLHYNLSVGFRINFFHLFYRFIFWAPLCLVGITPGMILFLESLTAIWNFLIHTEKIKKLGLLDLVFNTPSNHRVHHASNPQYIDKNLGGILIIYDRLFGTYAKETVPPVYGITHNIYSHNPKDVLLH
ncbi:MAG TPA: sterol desaturase family protein, partial [Chitinophagaceae bacterium]|nr:sterol desaturase family protein [Chitinophagaceae bacterium]